MTTGVDLTARFARQYLPGTDCRLACVRNALACDGLALSPPAVLGLSGALCFVFADAATNRFPFDTVAGISDQTVGGVAAALGAYLSAGTHPADEPFAGSPADGALAAGRPVHVAVHRASLRRAQGRSAMPQDDVGAHFVTLTAYDAEADVYTVFETDDRIPFAVPGDALRAAWHHDRSARRPFRDPTLPCDGTWFALALPPGAHRLWSTAVPHALHRVVHGFFSPPVSTMGEPALPRFADRLGAWPDELGAREDAVLRNVRLLQVTVGPLSGGGLGRRLYARFLRQVAAEWRSPALAAAASAFDASAAAWQRLAADALLAVVGHAAGRSAALAAVLDAQVPALVDLERAQFERLAGAVAPLASGEPAAHVDALPEHAA
jgi:hypothetical protein